MQNERTIRFWDDFYDAQEPSTDKEWILHPSEPLLKRISQCLVDNQSTCCRILEIGCGTSSLGRELWKYMRRISRGENGEQQCASSNHHLLATDVSEVCIRQNQERDSELCDSEQEGGGVEYRVLDITKDYPELKGSFDLILDKGCLDTFLFRSRQRGGGSKPYGPLVQNVVNNIQSWLSESGVYTILSPRNKLKTVRDYAGFSSVERITLDPTELCRGDLEGQDGEQESLFLYACRKNLSYTPGVDRAFPVEKPKPEDGDSCQRCALTFLEFRKGEAIVGRGEAYWFRMWRGHCAHCKIE